MAAGCEGGSWNKVRKNWSLVKYYAMIDWWGENGPPVYISVAGYLGLIKKRSPKVREGTGGNLEELENMFASSGGMIQ